MENQNDQGAEPAAAPAAGLSLVPNENETTAAAAAAAAAAAPAKVDGRRGSKIDAYAHLVGTMPDAKVAEMAGVSGEAVRLWRVRHGIDAIGTGGPRGPRGSATLFPGKQKPGRKARILPPAAVPAPAPAPKARKTKTGAKVAKNGGKKARLTLLRTPEGSAAVGGQQTWMIQMVVDAPDVAAAAKIAGKAGGTVMVIAPYMGLAPFNFMK